MGEWVENRLWPLQLDQWEDSKAVANPSSAEPSGGIPNVQLVRKRTLTGIRLLTPNELIIGLGLFSGPLMSKESSRSKESTYYHTHMAHIYTHTNTHAHVLYIYIYG